MTEGSQPSTEEIQRRILKVMADKGVGARPCPVCGNPEWMIGAYVVPTVVTNPSTVSLGGPSYPCVSLLCRRCGNTHLLNLYLLGFTKEQFQELILPELPGTKEEGSGET
jgi:hypothetical protein